MERFLQYLDDLDDLYGAIGLVWEKLRRTLLNLISLPHWSSLWRPVESLLRSRIRPLPSQRQRCCL